MVISISLHSLFFRTTLSSDLAMVECPVLSWPFYSNLSADDCTPRAHGWEEHLNWVNLWVPDSVAVQVAGNITQKQPLFWLETEGAGTCFQRKFSLQINSTERRQLQTTLFVHTERKTFFFFFLQLWWIFLSLSSTSLWWYGLKEMRKKWKDP